MIRQVFFKIKLFLFFCSTCHLRKPSVRLVHRPAKPVFRPRISPIDCLLWAKCSLILFWPFVFNVFNFLFNFCYRNIFGNEMQLTQSRWSITVFSNPKRIPCAGRRIAAASSTATFSGNYQIALQSLEAALEELAAPVPRADGEETFNKLAVRPMLEESLASRTWPA